VDFAKVLKPLKRRLKLFSRVDSVRDNVGKRNLTVLRGEESAKSSIEEKV